MQPIALSAFSTNFSSTLWAASKTFAPPSDELGMTARLAFGAYPNCPAYGLPLVFGAVEYVAARLATAAIQRMVVKPSVT